MGVGASIILVFVIIGIVAVILTKKEDASSKQVDIFQEISNLPQQEEEEAEEIDKNKPLTKEELSPLFEPNSDVKE
jgi:hypothetical protein